MRDPDTLPRYDDEDIERTPFFKLHDPSEDWKYDFNPVEGRVFSDYELSTVGEKGNPWMGKNARDRIENNKMEDGLHIGYTEKSREIRELSIDYEGFSQHIALFGQTDYGKSTLMRNMLLQVINSGHGACYVDPKGNGGEMLMSQIPLDRAGDVVWVEPGSDRDSQVGFNIFNTVSEENDEYYEEEVSRISDDFVAVLIDESSNWSSDIRNIIKEIVEKLIYSKDNPNPIDLLKVLNLIVGDGDSFPERLVKLNQEYKTVLDSSLMVRVANQDEQEFKDVLEQLRELIRSRPARSIVASKEPETTIIDAVKDDKLVVVDTSNIRSSVVRDFVTETIVYRIWSGIKFKQRTQGDSYFLCIDDFDKTVGQSSRIKRIARESKSSRLCLILANKNPSQLPEELKTILTQFGSLLSFHPGNDPRDQSEIAKILGDVDSWKIGDLNSLQVVGRIPKNGRQQDSILMGIYPEYPRLRDSEEAEEIVRDSIEKNAGNPHRYLGDEI